MGPRSTMLRFSLRLRLKTSKWRLGEVGIGGTFLVPLKRLILGLYDVEIISEN